MKTPANIPTDRSTAAAHPVPGRSARARQRPEFLARLMVPLLVAVLLSGCTSVSEYVHNGFKVGPNYGRPPAPVAEHWMDAADIRIRSDQDDLSQWWKVFNDPELDALICHAYRQNLTLKEAGFRVLQARAQLAITAGELFPQSQNVSGSYTRSKISTASAGTGLFGLGAGAAGATAGAAGGTAGTGAGGAGVGGAGIGAGFGGAGRYFSQLSLNFALAWELDFWGRFRRAVEAAEADLDNSVESYDDVLVTLLGDVATNYVRFRILQQQIALIRENARLQNETLKIVQTRFVLGKITELDAAQARSTLAQTLAQIPQTEIQLRQVTNRLCVLLGIPPEELQDRLAKTSIPVAPREAAAGIPASLLRRRPDVRRAERLAAAESARIGVAQADLYPHISINGSFGWSAPKLQQLFTSAASQGSFSPTFRWDILNYGRLLNTVRLRRARFQEVVATYQGKVLTAAEEVENGLATFLKAQEEVKYLQESVDEAKKAVKIAKDRYQEGKDDILRLVVLEQTLVQQENLLAQARGDSALGLIQVYRALGGGWQIRYDGCDVPGPFLPLHPLHADSLPTSGAAPPQGPTRAEEEQASPILRAHFGAPLFLPAPEKP